MILFYSSSFKRQRAKVWLYARGDYFPVRQLTEQIFVVRLATGGVAEDESG